MNKKPQFETEIWLEEAESLDPFLNKASYCHGFDVYGQVLQKASFSEYLFLLFIGEPPSVEQNTLFNYVAISVANYGPRDEAVRAAMNSGVGGAPAAANLMSALAVGAGNFNGAREIFQLVQCFTELKLDIGAWKNFLMNPNQKRLREDIWQSFEHVPGFLPHANCESSLVSQLLEIFCSSGNFSALKWLKENQWELQENVGYPMGIQIVIAAALSDLSFNSEKAEMIYSILRLPGAAVHALEAKNQGWRKFPFFGSQLELTDDPGKIDDLPDVSEVLK